MVINSAIIFYVKVTGIYVLRRTCVIAFERAKNKGDTILSKRLSYLLRHGAVKEGLTIKSDGFVAVNEILLVSLKGYTFKDIERVVENNNKQRFILQLNDGIWEIKATQGHTIAKINELTLKVLHDIDFDIIHGTYFKCWEKIKEEGLCRMKRNHIHFAKGLNFLCGLRQSAEVYIYINFKEAKQDGLVFLESENRVILCAGNSRGIIEGKYFLKVLDRSGHVLNRH